MKQKNTLVIGASENPERYSNKAIRLLNQHKHPVFAIGNKTGKVDGIQIVKELDKSLYPEIDTITLYLGPKNQAPYFELIKNIHPKRVLFNPGTENQELTDFLVENNIEWEQACTLVLLNTNQY
jgi:predicted CoA-binding protein